MKYKKTVDGIFLSRPNRFIAKVLIEKEEHTVHVKNTGRCKELLLPGSKVVLSESENLSRKTKYDLIAVYKENLGLVNIDSQAPNAVVKEWLSKQDFDVVKPEYTYGDSRIDFYMERGNKKYLCEVKGCTLEKDGIGYFPDAPTIRGTKHLRELTMAAEQGYEAYIAFVIQIPKVKKVYPNTKTDPEFSKALEKALSKGVKMLCLCCEVKKDELYIKQ